jgi:phosphoglycolate phosphatase-like HAD superfamily hydrolase
VPSKLTIFLDDGGVMNDNSLRGPQWNRLLAGFLKPRLGGQTRDWAEGNRVVAERMELRYKDRWRVSPHGDHLAFRDESRTDWLSEMCEYVGVTVPGASECLALANEANAYVNRRVRSAIPGAVDAIRRLHGQGHRLHTSSGKDSDDLDDYLEAMEVRDLFGRLYSPDLVDTAKTGPVYYERIFDDAQVEPGLAMVVDDSPMAVAWASEAGAIGVFVSSQGSVDYYAHRVIGSLAGLPALLDGLASD